MANIANLAVQLTMGVGGLETGLQKAATKLQGFGQSVGSLISAPTRHMQALGNKVGGAFTGILDGVKNVAMAIPIVGTAFAALPTSASGFLGWLKEGMSEIAAMSKAAQRLGVDVGSMATIQMLAGGSAEDMERGMFKLAAQLGEVRSGSKAAAEKFELLGLDGKALAALPLDQALVKIMERTRALENPMDKAHLVLELMGKSGSTLIPVLNKGAAGFAEAAERAQSFGANVNAIEASNVVRAMKAMRTMDTAMKGIQRSAAIAFAPLLESVANVFGNLVKDTNGFRSAFGTMVEWLTDKLASFMETLGEMATSIEELVNKLKAAPAKVSNGWNSLKMGLGFSASFESEPDIAPASGKVEAFLKKQAAEMRRRGKEARTMIPTAGPAGLMDMGPTPELLKSIRDANKQLEMQVATYGDLASAMTRFKLVEDGATAALLKSFDARALELEVLGRITSTATGLANIFDDFTQKADWLNKALEDGRISAYGYRGALRKLDDELDKASWAKAAAVFAETSTPLEKFSDKIGELNGLLDMGRIGWTTYSRAVNMAGKELIALKGAAEFKGAGLALAGSQEAHKAIVEASAGDRAQNPVELLKQAIDRQERQAARTAKDVNEIATAVRRGLFKVAPLP